VTLLKPNVIEELFKTRGIFN